MAVAALSVLRPQQSAFVLLRKALSSSNKRQHSSTVGENEEKGEGEDRSKVTSDRVEMCTLQQLSASLQLRSAASKMNQTGIRGDNETAALHLAVCLEELGESDRQLVDSDGTRFAEIFSRCTGGKYPKSNHLSSSSSSERAAVIQCMAATAAAMRDQSTVSERSSRDHRLLSEYSPQAGRGLTRCSGRSTLHPWTPLLDVLSFLDTPSVNWALHRAAFDGVLSETALEVPAALVSSYRTAGGDMGMLLRVLLSRGRLLEACHLATELVRSHSEKNATIIPREDKRRNVIIPYKTIDEVIIASRRYDTLTTNALASSIDQQRQRERVMASLKAELSQLEGALKRHFTLILAAEIN